MENKLKKDINTCGTIGYIISIFLIVAIITAMVINGIAIAAAASVSGEDVNVSVNSVINVTSSGNIFNNLDKFISFDGMDELEGELEQGAVASSDSGAASLERTDEGYVLNIDTNPMTFTVAKLIVVLVCSFVYLATILIMFYMLKALMKAFKNCDTPFSADVIKRLQNFAYSLIPYAVVSTLFESFTGNYMIGGKFEISFNMTRIIVIAVVFILVIIFKYGAELQRQSDETL